MSQKARALKNSRLYDRFMATIGKRDGNALYLASNAVVINANSVRDYLWHQSDGKQFSTECVLPPFETTFVEFLLPVTDSKLMSAKGLLCIRDLKPTDGEYTFYIYFVDDFGWMGSKNFWVMKTDTQGCLINGKGEFHHSGNSDELLGWEFQSLASVALMTFALLHCKNIGLATNRALENHSRIFEREFGNPLTDYKTLTIKPFGNKSEGNDNKPFQGLMPLHLRRGHFVTYTEDAPAFGKPWGIGTFWKEAVVVGEAKNGVVVKDYEVKPDNGQN